MTQVKTGSTGGLTSVNKIYNKAIRDKIPQIINSKGEQCIVKRLTDAEFLPQLEKKLHEELDEYDKNKSLDELADILEVIYRIAKLRGISREKMETICKKKAEERGGFEDNLFLIRTYGEAN